MKRRFKNQSDDVTEPFPSSMFRFKEERHRPTARMAANHGANLPDDNRVVGIEGLYHPLQALRIRQTIAMADIDRIARSRVNTLLHVFYQLDRKSVV